MKKIFAIIAPILFTILINIQPFDNLNKDGMVVLATLIWMVLWWVLQVVPIYITATLPIILLPSFCSFKAIDFSYGYAHPIIFLILAGSLFSIALQKVGLNKKIALSLIELIGYSEKKIMLGICITTFMFSMWMSNSSTVIMMLPVVITIIGYIDDSKFSKCLLLLLAYSASIGGMSTIIGTPPNGILVSQAQIFGDIEISFFEWMKVGFPIALTCFVIMYYIMTNFLFKFDNKISHKLKNRLNQDYKKLGKINLTQKKVIILFCLVIFLWIFSKNEYLNMVIPKLKDLSDTAIALMAAIMLFVINGNDKKPILTWDYVSKRIPFDVILLIGGGIALAVAIKKTGIVSWGVSYIDFFDNMNIIIICIVIALFTTFLTEINSNTATSIILIPIFWIIAEKIGMNPLIISHIIALSASTAFMLPTATVPNAIVMQNKSIEINDMMRAGFYLNWIIPSSIALLIYFIFV